MNARMGSSLGASTMFLSSTDRASLSDGDYASGVQLCVRATMYNNKKAGAS